MLQITPKHQLFIAVEPIDFRKGINSLHGTSKLQWNVDPFAGHIFIFRNRRATSIKILGSIKESVGNFCQI